jgi:hypothetical protein
VLAAKSYCIESASKDCAAESGGEPALCGTPSLVGIPSLVGATRPAESAFNSISVCVESSDRVEQETTMAVTTTITMIFNAFINLGITLSNHFGGIE